jgi:hypothetical protein
MLTDGAYGQQHSQREEVGEDARWRDGEVDVG